MRWLKSRTHHLDKSQSKFFPVSVMNLYFSRHSIELLNNNYLNVKPKKMS